MVTKNRPLIRTPRKDKSWAFERLTFPIAATTGFTRDLLAQYKTDLGLNQTRNVTSIRIIGEAILEELGDATTPAYIRVFCGIAWVPPGFILADIEPWLSGLRNAEYLQLGTIEGMEASTAVAGRAAEAFPREKNRWVLDITQMRKQPTPTHELRIMFKTSGLEETSTLGIRMNTGVMLALP